VTDAAEDFPRIVREHQDRVFSLALRLCCGDRGEAEELAHDAFVKAYRAYVTYDAERRRTLQVRQWLATITLNEARNRARSAARRRDRLSPDGVLPESLDGAGDATARIDDRDALVTALYALPEAQREAIVLRHIGDLSYAQIGAILHRSEATVRTVVMRGLRTLRWSTEEEDT
jgi:RNA polymerase sigma factor (sigma-70 family)